MDFPQKLKALRKELHVSQEELAGMTGLSWRAISQYERGENMPRMPAMLKLAEAFHVTTDFLMDSSADLDSRREPYVEEARERYGEAGAMEISELLAANRALFAGGELSEEAMDEFFQAVTTAYFMAKDEAKRRRSEGDAG